MSKETEKHLGKAVAPVAELIGFEMIKHKDGMALIELEAQQRHANPMGTLHGGILCDIADAAMGMAMVSTLKEGESFTTLELKINFLRPFWQGKLTAEGKVIQGGRTVTLLECTVADVQGRRIAYATSTCMTLRGDSTKGRETDAAAKQQ